MVSISVRLFKFNSNQSNKKIFHTNIVPPIIVKLPRMEMPQLVIGANLIKNPKGIYIYQSINKN